MPPCPPPPSTLFFFDARGLLPPVGRGSLLLKGDVASRLGEPVSLSDLDGEDLAGEGLPLAWLPVLLVNVELILLVSLTLLRARFETLSMEIQ